MTILEKLYLKDKVLWDIQKTYDTFPIQDKIIHVPRYPEVLKSIRLKSFILDKFEYGELIV